MPEIEKIASVGRADVVRSGLVNGGRRHLMYYRYPWALSELSLHFLSLSDGLWLKPVGIYVSFVNDRNHAAYALTSLV